MTGNMELSFSNGLKCTITKPTKAVMNMALLKARKDRLALSEVILNKCYVSGDKEIQSDSGCLLEFLEWIDEVCDVKTCEFQSDADFNKLIFDDGVELTLEKPSRVIVSDALNKAGKAPLGVIELLINCCYIDGDKDKVLNDIGYLIPASEYVEGLIQKKTMSLKKS